MSAKIILDSVSPLGDRLTTMEVRMHRFVLAEFNTHRAFSRNSASSRAIPVTKQLDRLKDDPAWPLQWPKEQPGMQGGDELAGQDLLDATSLISTLAQHVIEEVERYVEAHDPAHRLHKSVLNRVLEPFMWHTVIVSSTEWENFFAQRCSPLAQPEIRVVAEEMREALYGSTPVELDYGQWHTPYIQDDEVFLGSNERCQVSAARCARVSFLTHDGRRSIEDDVKLFGRLVEADPPHWSPLEHVARPVSDDVPGNFTGWIQLRHDW